MTVRNAKIVCTLGPSSADRATIRDLSEAGMSVARLNASHGTTEDRRAILERVEAVNEEAARPVATILDLAGPEVRTADIEDSVELEAGSTVTFVRGESVTRERIGLTESLAGVTEGTSILLDDGRIEATVTGVEDGTVRARVDSGGTLASRTGVNVPDVDLDLPPLTAPDLKELDLAAAAEVDFVAASFVRSAEDVLEVSAALEKREADVPIIAKIERADAVENVDEIIEAAYGVMIARGDLGVECPLEDVPMIQKRIVRRAHRAGVPVITATEMLDSMIHEHRPTRAEASDVANAVLDGTDAVMLSGETAIGDHPVRVVETMDRIIQDVEESEEYDELREQRVPPAGDTRTDALARSARFLARDVDASAVVAASESGYTARKAAKYRPSIPIIASTPNERVRRQLALSWGIVPMPAHHTGESADAVIQTAVQSAIETGAADSGDTVVVIAGMMTELEGLNTANTLKVHVASEPIASGRSIVPGLVSGPLHVLPDGDLRTAPEGAIVAVPDGFEGEFTGDLGKIGGILDGHQGVTGYAAIVARELDVPAIADAEIPADFETGTIVTLDSERGVVYADPIEETESRPEWD